MLLITFFDLLYGSTLINNKLDWSDEIYRIFGIKPQEFEATYEAFLENIHPEDKNEVNEAYTNSLKNKTPYEIEHRLLLETGELKYVMEKCNTEFDIHGNPIRSLGTVLDITNQKLTEIKLQKKNEEYAAINEELTASEEEIRATNEELIIARDKAEESDQLKTEFINNMSHEIRTPMNGILGFSSILNRPSLTNDKRKYYTDIIQTNGYQLLKIIDDILEISKLGTKQVKTIEKEIILNDLFLELFSIYDRRAKERKIPLYLQKGLFDEASKIFTDKSKLKVILCNLLDNSLKYTNEGFIEFGYRIIATSVFTSHQLLEIYVKDTGIGIKLENQKTIFKRFSQEEKELSKNVGGLLGLGLSIAKENAKLLGGKITLKSEKGRGQLSLLQFLTSPSNLMTKKTN